MNQGSTSPKGAERGKNMTTELRNAVTSEAFSTLTKAFPSDVAVLARVNKKDVLLVKSSQVDEAGLPVYYTVEVTVKSNAATKTHAGFDPNAAIAEKATHDADAATKGESPKKGTPKVDPEVEARRKARLDAAREWMRSAEPGKEYTATEIFNQIGEEKMGSVMLCGSTMQKLVPDVSIVVHDGKKYYVVE